jgi:hypothetical protein
MVPDDSDKLNRTDRELMLSLREQMKWLTRAVAELKEDLTKFIEGPRSPVWDHEQRLRRLENFRWWILGAIAASAGLAGFISRVWR